MVSNGAPSTSNGPKLKATSEVATSSSGAAREDLDSDGFKKPTRNFRASKDDGDDGEPTSPIEAFSAVTETQSKSNSAGNNEDDEQPKRKRGRPPKAKRGRPSKIKSPEIEAASRANALKAKRAALVDESEDVEDEISDSKPQRKKKVTEIESSDEKDVHVGRGSVGSSSPYASSYAAQAAVQIKKSKARIEDYGHGGVYSEDDLEVKAVASRPKTSDHSGLHTGYTKKNGPFGEEADELVDRILSSAVPTTSRSHQTATTTQRYNPLQLSQSSEGEEEEGPFDARKAIEAEKAKRAAAANGVTREVREAVGGSSGSESLKRDYAQLRQLYEDALRENEVARSESEAVVEEWKEYCQKMIDKADHYKNLAKMVVQRSREAKAEADRLQAELDEVAGAQQEREFLVQQNTALKDEIAALQESIVSAEASHLRKLTKLEALRKKDREAISKLTDLSIMFEGQLETAQQEAQQLQSKSTDGRRMRALEMEADELRKENDAFVELVERLRQERDAALESARSESERKRELSNELSSVKTKLNDVEARHATLEMLGNSVSTARPEWTPSIALGPLESFISVAVDEENPKKWQLQCRNPKTQSELHFTLELLEDSFEYVPMDFKENSGSGNPSDLPEYLGRPIFFEPISLAPFLAKMLSFLYRAKN